MFKSVKINKVSLVLCSVLCLMLAAVAFNVSSPNIVDAPVSTEVKQGQSVDVPIIMYHAVSDVQSIQGEYVISSAEFENDLKYLADNGYTTVFVEDIVNFVNGNGSLPEKPIVLTFDDGYYNNYLYVFPLLKKYNAKATISPIAYYSELYTETTDVNECYSHSTWSELKEMHESGCVEIGNHTYNLHTNDSIQTGVGKISGESSNTYKERITQDILTAQNMIKENTGKECTVFAYPFGKYNETAEDTVRNLNFTAILTCNGGINHLTQGDNESLYELKRLIRPHNSGLENILK